MWAIHRFPFFLEKHLSWHAWGTTLRIDSFYVPRDFSRNSELLKSQLHPDVERRTRPVFHPRLPSTQQRTGWRWTGLSVSPCRRVKKKKNQEWCFYFWYFGLFYWGWGGRQLEGSTFNPDEFLILPCPRILLPGISLLVLSTPCQRRKLPSPRFPFRSLPCRQPRCLLFPGPGDMRPNRARVWWKGLRRKPAVRGTLQNPAPQALRGGPGTRFCRLTRGRKGRGSGVEWGGKGGGPGRRARWAPGAPRPSRPLPRSGWRAEAPPPPRAPPPTPASAPPPAPRGSSICIRRWLQGLPGAHVTPGRRREPADLTRAAVRLPLARNSESSRDLRPRPPAANKSAGRLQTQNFHVGKSQDGRERSGARGGEPARECLAAGAGGAGWGACGGHRRGHAGGRPGPGRPEPDHPPPVPGASGHPAFRQPPVHPTAPPALSLGGRRVGDGGERLGGKVGKTLSRPVARVQQLFRCGR